MTAENRPLRPRPKRAPGSFNEAAADDRGKPSCPWSRSACPPIGFNEAAADDRGKPPSIASSQSPTSTLQ